MLALSISNMPAFQILFIRCRNRRPHGKLTAFALTTPHTYIAVIAFDQGANDYLSRPISSELLKAQVHAKLRRGKPLSQTNDYSGKNE